MTSPTVRRGAPLAAGVAVLALVGGSAYLLRDGAAAPGSSTPPPLRIGAGIGAADSAADPDRVIVSGDLPDGPADARVHRFSKVDPDVVAGLADALGVEPSQVQTGTDLPVMDATVLRMDEGRGGAWQFARAGALRCVDYQPLGDGGPDSTVSSTCTAPAPTDKPGPDGAPSAAAAVAAARPVLSAAGVDLDEDELTSAAVVDADTRTFWIDPVVAGAPTSGVPTIVVVDSEGIRTASGWLARTEPGDSYPVITAREAVDQLASMPMPLIGCAESATPVPPGPVCGGPLEVTGAAFGTSVQWEGERAVLVPSWLFHIKGNDRPLPVVAVDPSYLADPFPVDEPGDGASGSGTGMPGSTGGADPGTAEPPVAPSVQPTASTSRFDSVAPVEGGAALRVTFYGGVESCYTYTVVAEETAEQVALRLVEERNGDVCIDLAQQYERTVDLKEPLGSRPVMDADTNLSLYPDRSGG